MSNPEQIENEIKAIYDYISTLRHKLNCLKHAIKNEQEKLEENQSIEDFYNTLLLSDCTGKGYYNKIIMRPVDIKEYIDHHKDNMTLEQLQEYTEKLQKANEEAEHLQNTYVDLGNTQKERLKNIRESKKNISKYSEDKNKCQKEIKKREIQAQKLDKKLNGNQSKKFTLLPNKNSK